VFAQPSYCPSQVIYVLCAMISFISRPSVSTVALMAHCYVRPSVCLSCVCDVCIVA